MCRGNSCFRGQTSPSTKKLCAQNKIPAQIQGGMLRALETFESWYRQTNRLDAAHGQEMILYIHATECDGGNVQVCRYCAVCLLASHMRLPRPIRCRRRPPNLRIYPGDSAACDCKRRGRQDHEHDARSVVSRVYGMPFRTNRTFSLQRHCAMRSFL